MNHILKYWTLLFFFINYAEVTFGQPDNPIFQNYHTEQGLPQNTINTIYQDHYGFMWFGTQDGLTRFDGYQFKNFRHDPQNKNSLANNYLWHINEDAEGIFWLSSFGGGLTRFNPADETFTHYKREPANKNSLSHSNTFSSVRIGENIWIATNDGLCRLDIKTGNVERFIQQEENREGQTGNYIGQLAFQQPNFLWMSSSKGLIQFDTKTSKNIIFENLPFGDKMSFTHIRDIQVVGEKVLLTTPTHFLEVDFANGTHKILLRSDEIESNEKIVFSKFIASIDGQGYWIGSNNGLIYFDPQTRNCRLFQHSKENRYSLPSNSILSLYRSKDGVLWVGTQDGLAKLEREKNEFGLLRNQPEKKNTLSDNHIKGVVEDENGRLWIPTTKGLNVYDRKAKKYHTFNHQNKNLKSLSSDYLLSLCLDDKKTLWIGTRGGGLNQLVWEKDKPLSTAYFKRYNLNNANIQYILDDGNVLWLGTGGRGLIRFEKSTGNSQHYPMQTDGSGPNHTHIYHVFKDSYGNYWLGTATGGINLFDPKNERFLYIRNSEENPNSLVNNLVLCFFEDSKNQLWTGTAGGLSRLKAPLEKGLFEKFWDKNNLSGFDLFENYGRKNSFPNEVIYGILEDNNGFFWLSTNEGLVKFNLQTEAVEKIYHSSDGLQSNEHNQNAYFKNPKSELFFGGVNGLNFFHPDNLKGNTFVPPVQITEFRLYNEIVPLESYGLGAGFQLESAPYATKVIQLDYHQKVISFGFTALSFINPRKNKYLYKLEGFDADWLPAGENRLATYTNLDPGEYVFRVKAANNDGLWNEKGTSLKLIISPPWWRTVWAYLAYAVLFLLSIFAYVRLRIRATTRTLMQKAEIEKVRTEERETFRQQSARDFHDEAGNKITKINLLTELAKRESENDIKRQEYLDSIEQNTKKLAAGMRDFIWSMDSGKDTFYDTAIRLQEFGESLFSLTNSRFSVFGLETGLQKIKVSMQVRRTLLLIFKEAMNNCAKYANASEIGLSFAVQKNSLEIKLEDNGCGFDINSTNIQKGYGLKNMEQRSKQINAELTVQSEKGKGTVVIVKCPI